MTNTLQAKQRYRRGTAEVLALLFGVTALIPSAFSAEPGVTAKVATQRGWWLLHDGLYSLAISEFQSALKLRPASPGAYAGRAACHLHLGHYHLGIVDLKAAIRCHPNDRGIGYQAQTNKSLSRKALEHGERQVRKMLVDRPAMAKHVKPNDTLWLWAVRKFAGEDTGFTIDWDPTPPRGADAQHASSSKTMRGCVRIKKAPSREEELTGAFEDLWSCAVFELHNITHTKEFEAVWSAALAGKVTKAEFVFQMFEIEYRAAQQTRAFYASVYLPWARAGNLPTNVSNWYVLMWDEPTKDFKKYTDRSSYPWQPYGRYYLKAQGYSLYVRERYNEAVKAYQEYLLTFAQPIVLSRDDAYYGA